MPEEPSAANGEVGAQGWGDDGFWEVGVHYTAADLRSQTRAEGWGLYNKLRSCGRAGRYIWGGRSAWEQEFKRYAKGGTENYYLDKVDLAFYVRHGNPWGFYFENPYHDDARLTPGDCYRSWGDGDNEYVALTSCQVLHSRNMRSWARCMYGTHLILGFHTTAIASPYYWRTQGYNFAKYLCRGYTVPQAWYKAADRSQPAGRVVRVLGNEPSCFSDRPKYNRVCADSYDWDWWYGFHYAGSEPPRQVDVATLGDTMPIFRTQPLSLSEAEGQYDNLGNVFSITVGAQARSIETVAVQGEDAVWVADEGGRELEMGQSSGLYGYMDLNTLWTGEQMQSVMATDIGILSAANVYTIANQFLTNNGLMPADAQFYEVVSDTVASYDVVSSTAGSEFTFQQMAAEQPILWQVIYSRILTDVSTGSPVEYSVMGPGAKQKVYVSAGAADPTAQSSSSILGAMGGWRQVQQPVVQVPMLPVTQVQTLYDQLEETVTLNPSPIDADQREVLTYTVAYWEESLGVSQAELIPTYAFSVHFTSSTTDTDVTDYVYIPVHRRYMRPLARIDSVVPTDTLRAGDVITLTAADASKTLAELGYDASLNFVLGSGTEDDYLYDWFLESVDDANVIGYGRTITYTIQDDQTGRSVQGFVLRVTDINNPNPSSNTDIVTVEFYKHAYLPLILKE